MSKSAELKETALSKGNSAFREGDIDLAIAMYKKALAAAPELADQITFNLEYARSVRDHQEFDVSTAPKLNDVKRISKELSPSDKVLLDRVREYNAAKANRKAKVTVYTSITGGYDDVILPELIVDDWDYVIFTDLEIFGETIFEVRPLPVDDLDPVRIARYIKLNPHKVLPDREYTLWIDGNVLLKSGDFSEYINELIKEEVGITFRKHPERTCIYQEIEKCKELKKDDFGLMSNQLEKYRAESFPEDYGLFETNVVLRKNDPTVNKFNEAWWSELDCGSRRDQLSVMYAIQKHSIDYRLFEEKNDIREQANPWYYIFSHNTGKVDSGYKQPGFYRSVYSGSSSVENQALSKEPIKKEYSRYKPPYKVKKAACLLKELGFSNEGYEELTFLAENDKSHEIREHALWQIVLHRLDNPQKFKASETQNLIITLRRDCKNPIILKYLEFLLFDSFSESGSGDEISAKSQDSLHVDYLVSEMNSAGTENGKIELINQVFSKYNLSPVRYVKFGQEALYDSIFPASPINRFRYIESQLKVSVIVPAYNAEHQIKTTLFSMLSQTWYNIEIIVVDDNSSDNTVQVVEELARFDDRIRLLKNSCNSGPYVSRNSALKIANGNFVTVVDSDDWSHPQKIQLQVESLIENPNLVANVACWIRTTENLDAIRRGNPFYKHLNISSLMFRKNEVLPFLGGWDAVKFGADGEFYKRLIRMFGRDRVQELDAVTSLGRVEERSLTNSSKFGYNGFPFGARREYLESYEFFHRHSEDSELNYGLGGQVRYPVPLPMRPGISSYESKVDLCLIDDFRNINSADNAIDFIESCRDKGLTFCLVQINSPEFDPRAKVHDRLRSFLVKHSLTLTVYGEAILAKEVIVHSVKSLLHQQRYVPNITAGIAKLVFRQRDFRAHFLSDLEEIKEKASSFIRSTYSPILFDSDAEAAASRYEVNQLFGSALYSENLIVTSSSKLDNFSYNGSKKVCVVMPCIDLELGKKAAEIMLSRAGIDCSVVIVMDDIRKGFIATLNQAARKIDSRFICYVAQDAFPGRNWLNEAYAALENSGKGVLGFNDGKWKGRIAAFGMVRKRWVRKFYDDEILASSYRSHKADNEITVLAKLDNNYVYCSDSVLLEVDYRKDAGGSNLYDDQIFAERFNSYFGGRFEADKVEALRKEYKVKPEIKTKSTKKWGFLPL
ncbi:glycosyltransferase [Microbulbifer sp. JSM ZJ756]|uniref:glycosyltransferase n=1 Tax=Microbulbifer sp. JSM ZJ756 TaxID=3376191 RepID=UPI00378B6590